MRSLPTAILSVALATAPMSAASAQEDYYHHHHYWHGPLGLVGAVVVGAVTIATLPIRIVADAVSGPHYDRRGDYDRRYGGSYGGAPAYRGEDSNAYGGPQGEYADAPRYGYPPRGYYSAPPPNYRPDYREGDDERGYAPPNAYAQQEYGPPRGYYQDRREYGPSPNYGPRDDEYSGSRDGYEQRSYRERSYDDDGDE